MKSLAIFATLFAVASAHAGTILPRPEQKKMQQLVAPLSKTESCTNFSGNWAGSCMDASGETPVDLKITQHGCEFITFDSTSFAIGGTHQENDSVPNAGGDYLSSVTTNLNWDAKKAYLVSSAGAYVSQTGKGVIYANEYQGYVALNDGKLVSAVQGQATNVACTLQKK